MATSSTWFGLLPPPVVRSGSGSEVHGDDVGSGHELRGILQPRANVGSGPCFGADRNDDRDSFDVRASEVGCTDNLLSRSAPVLCNMMILRELG